MSTKTPTALSLPDDQGVPADQEEKVFGEILRLVEEGVKHLAEAAVLLGRLTREQRRKFAAKCPLLNRGYIENLALLGQKIMAPHLALKPKSLPAGFFLRLPEAARKALNDPNYPLEIWDGHGKVYVKLAREANALELRQVCCTRRGILSPEEQSRRVAPPPPRKIKGQDDVEKVTESRMRDKQWVLLIGEHGGEMQMLLRDMRRKYAAAE